MQRVDPGIFSILFHLFADLGQVVVRKDLHHDEVGFIFCLCLQVRKVGLVGTDKVSKFWSLEEGEDLVSTVLCGETVGDLLQNRQSFLYLCQTFCLFLG